MPSTKTLYRWCKSRIVVRRSTAKAHLLGWADDGSIALSADVWVPKSCLRITPGKDTIEIADWFVDDKDLWGMTADDESEAHE